MEKYFDIPRPWDFDVIDENKIVGAEDDGTSTGGGDDASGATDDDDPFCFTVDAMVHMTDGSFKRITDVQEEDYALHGTGFGEGLVTEKLIHPTGVVVSAAVVETEDGVLIGDPSCPVLMHGEWVDLNNQFVSLATRQYIDAFYNLKIDGHLTDTSSRSYCRSRGHGFWFG